MTNLPVVLSTLNQEISVLTEKLAPIGDAHVSQALESLLAAGLTLPSSMDPDKAPAVYSFAMSSVCVHGLRRAVDKLIRGEYEDISRAFVPRPPELAALARQEARHLVDDLVRAKQTRDAMVAPPPRVSTPESKAKAKTKALLDMFHQHNAAYRERSIGIPPNEPMSPEQAEYWAKIAALSDASTITAEQQAFRRKIGMDLESAKPQDKEQAA